MSSTSRCVAYTVRFLPFCLCFPIVVTYELYVYGTRFTFQYFDCKLVVINLSFFSRTNLAIGIFNYIYLLNATLVILHTNLFRSFD